jgi:hypothetical protein
MFIDTVNNRYPLYPGDAMIQVEGWQIGDQLPEGWFEVLATTPPAITESELYYEQEPELIDGVYTQTWAVRELTAEEIAVRQAPFTARQKLKDTVGLTDAEIDALIRGLR